MVIHDDLRFGIVIHGVDGEVAARGILLHRAPDVVAQHPSRGMHGVLHAGQFALAGALIATDLACLAAVQVRAEGRDLYHFMLAATAIDDVYDAKTPANDEGPAKQRLDLLGSGVGRDVKVFRAQANQQVAHCTAHNVGLKARLLEGMHHIHGAVIHQGGIDPVFLGTDFLAFSEG